MKKIAVIDNYDSFTFNLVHYLEALDCSVDVFRNDELDLKELEPYDKILLSPGPGLPKEAGLLLEVIRTYIQKKPILGICLGLQAIGEVYGAKLNNLQKVYHGVSTEITITDKSDLLFQNIPEKINVGRYHSWVIEPSSLPEVLKVTAVDEANQIMALTHRDFKLNAVQFHPESILTPHGMAIIKNWVEQI